MSPSAESIQINNRYGIVCTDICLVQRGSLPDGMGGIDMVT